MDLKERLVWRMYVLCNVYVALLRLLRVLSDVYHFHEHIPETRCRLEPMMPEENTDLVFLPMIISSVSVSVIPPAHISN